MPATLMYFEALCFLLLFIHNVRALGITFTSPAAGATLPSGPITVRWEDAGGTPDMASLVSGTVVLMVGGNSASNSQILQTIGPANTTISQATLDGEIDPAQAQSIQNGFYLMMTSNTTDGNTVINYSNRFTLIAMTGTTDSGILQGASAEAGAVSNVPAAQYNVIERPSPSSTMSSTPTTFATANPTSTVTSTSMPPPPHDGGGGGGAPLSGTDLAGLIVGAILACVGIVSLIIWAVFFYKRAKRRRIDHEAQDEIRKSIFAGNWGNKAELPARRSGVDVAMRELSPQQERFEAPGWDKLAEAPGDEPVFELEGDIALWEAGSGRRSKAYDPTAN